MTLLARDSRFLQHRTGSHPEKPARLTAIDDALEKSGLIERCMPLKAEPLAAVSIPPVHSPDYLDHLATVCQAGGGSLDPDTPVSPESFDVALLAAGTCLAAVDRVLNGDDRQALCLTRPPGHHALRDRAMGFCLLGNATLAAHRAVKVHDLERVLIVDWDVHHGNGTQALTNERPDVWFFSSHRSPFYPGTGAEDETGTGAGLGTKFNLPLAFGTSRRDILSQFSRVLTDAAERCRPQLVIISAGFDAHTRDPIGSLGLETEDFATLTNLVCDVANTYSEGRLISILEGGYNLQALGESVAVHLETLLAR
ncbi:MAG: histone deacetylase [Planctomycetaceae bacterium]|nr:histone deacetylase [Planctomycetaceae bacterium]